MKDLTAGLTAGVIAGFLFLTIVFLVLYLGSWGRIGLHDLASIMGARAATAGLGMPVEAIMFFLLVGFVFFSLAGAGLGAIMGILFAKVVNRLPIQSTYLKVLGLGFLIYFLTSFALGHFPDVYTLAAAAADLLIFSFLFVRLTNRPS
jgi:hypothetical protein